MKVLKYSNAMVMNKYCWKGRWRVWAGLPLSPSLKLRAASRHSGTSEWEGWSWRWWRPDLQARGRKWAAKSRASPSQNRAAESNRPLSRCTWGCCRQTEKKIRKTIDHSFHGHLKSPLKSNFQPICKFSYPRTFTYERNNAAFRETTKAFFSSR